MTEQLIQTSGAVTAVMAAAAAIWGMVRWARKITEGAKCQLRSDMLRTYYRRREAGAIRQYELENFILSYQAYRALGGNSFIERIYQEVRQWEVLT